jgi:hypothetical protein
MALLDDILNGGNLGTGVAVGAGALIAWPLIRLVARPLAKNLIKGGLLSLPMVSARSLSRASSPEPAKCST